MIWLPVIIATVGFCVVLGVAITLMLEDMNAN